MKRSILYILLFVLLFSACDNKDYGQGMLSANDKISIDKVEFHPTGGVVTFCITANDRWSVQGCNSNRTFKKWPWLSISNSVGNKGTSKVTLTAGPATTDVKSEIEFEIDGEYLSIPLSQEKPFLNAYVSDQSQIRLEVDGDTGKYKANFEWYHGKDVVKDELLVIIIDSNTDWKVVSVNDADSEEEFENIGWLYCSQKKSESEKTEDNPITFIPKTYNSGGKDGVRTATFRIVGYDDAKGSFDNVHTFTVTQPGLRFSVDEPTCENKDQAITSLPPCNVSPINMTVDSEVDWFWSVSDVLNQKDEVKNVDENNPTTVTITIPTNPTREPRKFDVTVTPKTGEFKDGKEIRPSIEYSLTQRAYDLEFLGHANYIYNHGKLGNDDTGEQRAQLKSSGAWQIDESTIPDWLNVSSSHSGKGFVYGDTETVDVVFNAKTRNYDEKDRSATVKVKSTEAGNTLETSLSVSQTKYVLSQPQDIYLPCTFNEATASEFNFESTGKWRLEIVEYLEGDKDWLKFSKSLSFDPVDNKPTGDGDGTVYYSVTQANVSETTDNVAKVRLVSVSHEEGRENGETEKELYKEFKIIHRKFVFNVTPEKAYEEENRFECKAVPDIYYYVDIDTSAGWEFDNSNAEWIKEYSQQDIGNGVIRFFIEVDKNTQVESRNGSFSIRSTHDWTKFATFNVHQEGYVWKVEPVKFYDEFAAVDAPAQKINVTCSGTWRITNLNADAKAMISNWQTLSNNSQTSGKALFEISNNYELQDREAEFTIQSDDDSKFRQKITFKQEAFEFEVRRETGNLDFDALAPKPVTFNIDISGEGLEYFDMDGLKTQLSKSGWFKVDNDNFKVNDKKITITPLENYQLEPNRLDLVFGSNGGHTPPFTLTQEAFEFDNIAGDLPFDASLTQQSREFKLESSTGDWRVTKDDDASWITVYPEKGSGSGDIRVTVAPHYTTDATVKEREGKIYVESVYVESNNKLSKQMTIKQSVYKLVVDNNKTDVPLLKDKDATESIPVTCSGEWDFQVTKGSEFIKAEKEDSTLVITALSTNSAVEERKATITLFTKNYTDTFTPLTLNITVTQEGTPKK